MGHRASTRDACRTKGLLLLVEQFPREFSKLDSPPSPGERERSAFSFDAARAFAFRTVSQINVNYRGSPLSQGKAGHLYGGGRDRMPRVVVNGVEDNLPGTRLWRSAPRTRDMHRARIRRCPGAAQYAEAGLARDAVYLLRPDALRRIGR
jgi:hypothetical protein